MTHKTHMTHMNNGNPFYPKNVKYSGPIQSLGIKCGVLVGFALFAELEHIFDFLTLSRWFLLVAIVVTARLDFLIFFLDFFLDFFLKKNFFNNVNC